MQYILMLRRYSDDECVPAYMSRDALAHQEQMVKEFNEAEPSLNLTVLGHMASGDSGKAFTYIATVEYDGDADKLTDYLQELYDEYGIAGRYIVMGSGENIKRVWPEKPTFTPPYAWGCANDAEIPHAWVAEDERKIYMFPPYMEAEAEATADKLNRSAYKTFCVEQGREYVEPVQE